MILPVALLLPILAYTPIHAVVQVTPTVIITGTGGPTLAALTQAIDGLLQPLDDFATRMEGMITADPEDMAIDVAGDASSIWGYLTYGNNIATDLVSLGLLITLFLVVMLVKLIMSIVKYLKQLIAQWV